MNTSAFGVEHFAKSDAQGSTESILDIAHGRGQHEGKSFRRCPKCSAGAWGAAQKRPAAVAETAEKIARKVH